MIRIPPPTIAMRLAEEHRHDLLKSAGKQPMAGSGGLSPLLCHRAVWARLGQLARWRHADRISSSTASKTTRFGPKRASARRARPSWVERAG
jgi:hypothetical protein